MATIKNRKKSPLRGAEIISRFPQGIRVPTFWDSSVKSEVVNLDNNPLLYTDPTNPHDAWYVDIASLYEKSEERIWHIKPEFVDYAVKARGMVLTLS